MLRGLSTRKILVALTLLGLVAVGAGTATFGAFSSVTGASGNQFAAGTVAIADNDAGTAMLGFEDGGPGSSDTSCIQVTYSGSLDAEVRLYSTVAGDLAPYLTLTVTRGTDSSAFDTCGSFVPDAGGGVVYDGPLSAFPATWSGGLADAVAGTPEVWQQSEAHAYRFTVSLGSDTAAQGLSGTASFTWEARNL